MKLPPAKVINPLKATEINLLKFLKQPNQFVIPIYQRTYSWTLKQCEQLWCDVVKLAEDEDNSGHFVGSIVYIEAGLYQVASVPQLLVIDGQQRLTTITLLLTALGRAISAAGDQASINRRKLGNYYLFNAEEEGDDRYKLLLTQGDRETFIRIIEERELPKEPSKRILENFEFFEAQIRKRNIDLDQLYEGLGKLLIVNIALERDRDNPQLIFESLNSTGLDLSQADLIRNYVLMGLPTKKQEAIYKNAWYPMEESFEGADQAGQFDRFIRDYLTLKSRSGAIPNIRDVYNSFKAYIDRQKETPVEALMAEVYRYSKYYVRLAFGQEEDAEIRKALGDINILRVDVAYPFLLEVYEDYSEGTLDKTAFIEVLRLVESYVFRRAICGIPTNSMNKTFATLSREIDREHYLESLKIALVRMESYKRFPTDPEFSQEFGVKDIYNFRNRLYLLRKLENHNRPKELADPDNYSIEHILPQMPNLSEPWQVALGEQWQALQAKYLHTIGNLTLTGYNSEYSDRPFPEKRDMPGGFKVSPLFLNQGLGQLAQWNEAAIQQRSEQLLALALKIWSYPDVAVPAQKQSECSSLTESYKQRHAEYLQGEIGELFEALRKRILNLDPEVREEFKKLYIAYKTSTNFVDVVPQRSRLRLSLNMRFSEVNDPKELCRDVTDVGRWGNGDVEIGLSSVEQLDEVMALVRQAFQKHSDLPEAA